MLGSAGFCLKEKKDWMVSLVGMDRLVKQVGR